MSTTVFVFVFNFIIGFVRNFLTIMMHVMHVVIENKINILVVSIPMLQKEHMIQVGQSYIDVEPAQISLVSLGIIIW